MKKMFLASVCLVLTACATAQNAYDVTLSCNDEKVGNTLYLFNAETQDLMDSATVDNHTFRFQGTLQGEPVVAVLSPKQSLRGMIGNFMLDATPMIMNYNSETQSIEVTSGSNECVLYAKEQARLDRTEDELREFNMTYRGMLQLYNNEIPDSIMENLEALYEKATAKSIESQKAILNENKDNLVPILPLLYGARSLGYDFVEEFLADYKYKDRETLKDLRDALESEKIKRPGTPVVNFSMESLAGGTMNLTDYVGKGQYVLVDFWASWCGPCRAEMPNVKAAYEKYHAKGFEIVGVSLDNKRDAWAKAVADLGITWPQMSDLKGWQSQGAATYNIKAIPATILFAPDGTVYKADLRGSQLEAVLAEIYGE